MKSFRRVPVCIVMALGLIVIAGITPAQVSGQDVHPKKKHIRLAGSKYAYFAVLRLAEAYMSESPSTDVRLSATDIHMALEELFNGDAHGVMVFGELDADELQEAKDRGFDLTRQLVGWGGVAMITNKSNPVNEISLDQVRDVYMEKITNWKDIGGPNEKIAVITRDESLSGTENYFRDFVLDGFPFPQRAIKIFDHDVVRAVWKRKSGAIADARISEALRGQRRGYIKVLLVKPDTESDPVAPSDSSVKSLRYPLSGPLVVYYDKESPVDSLKNFVEFCAARTESTRISRLSTGNRN